MDSLSSLSFNSNSISIIHIYIRSLQKKFDSELPNYKLVHIDSPTPAGGIAVYESNELRIEIVLNVSLNQGVEPNLNPNRKPE